MFEQNKTHILVALCFILLTILVTFPTVCKINSSIYGPFYGTDNRSVIWNFWWLKYSHQHGLNPTFRSTIAYPFGVDYNLKPKFPLSNFVFKWSTIFTSEILTYNFFLLASFILSGFFTYLLVFRLTKNKIASFISGLIFAFCPYHFNKAWEHFSLSQTQWIPLYVLVLLHLKDKPNLKNSIFLALAFTLIMGFDFSYTYIVFIFTLGFIIFVLLYQWKYKLGLKKVPAAVIVEKNCFKIIVMTGLALVIAAFINIFVLFPIFKNIFFTSKDNFVVSDIYVRSFKYLFSHSARPLSYLLPASSHPLFGKITESMFGSLLYGRNSIEHTLYLGWLPLLLSFFTFQQWKKKRLTAVRQNGPDKKADFIIGFLIFSAILAFIFSMPPYINLGIFKIYLPSFFMYKIIPVYRAYARFGFLMLFAISILAGFGLNYILLRFKKFKIKFLFSSLIILGILFEFINIPPFRVTDLSKPPKVYQWVSQQKGDFAIAEYPLGQTSLGEGFIPLNYLFWQRVHQKKLINGARMGTNAYKVKRKIHKITDKNVASYLAWLGVKYVIMHLDVYRDGTDQEAVDIIGEIPDLRKRQGFKLINKFDSEEVYEVTAKSIEVKFDDN